MTFESNLYLTLTNKDVCEAPNTILWLNSLDSVLSVIYLFENGWFCMHFTLISKWEEIDTKTNYSSLRGRRLKGRGRMNLGAREPLFRACPARSRAPDSPFECLLHKLKANQDHLWLNNTRLQRLLPVYLKFISCGHLRFD